MLSVERRHEILEILNKKGSVKVNDLAKRYGVGKETIRRDLKYLANEWNISVVYGGAHLKNQNSSTAVQEMNILNKRELNAEAKHKIAAEAAKLIEPGDVIAINSGSTVECILDYIADKTPLSILTVNVNVAAKASLIPGVEVYIPSGKVRGKSGMVISGEAENFISQFTIQKCFMGVSAISLGSQITHPAIEEVANNKSLLAVSEKTFLLADHSKFDKKSLYKLARLEEMEAIITDEEPSDPYKTYFRNYGIDVILPE